MRKTDLFRSLLPGLLPLLVFIVADEIWGTIIGMWVAVGLGIIEFTYIYIRQRKPDRFVLFDTLLIVAMGLVSIWLENEIFFRLKPFIIGIILCSILGISAFSGKNIMLLMSRRYLKNVSVSPVAEKRLHFTLQIMFWIFLLHTLLVLYAVFYMNSQAWAFISGPLLFILFGVFLVFEIVKTRFKTKTNIVENAEWVPLVDEHGKITGKATRDAVHNGSKLLHPVVHLHVINGNMMLLLQKRSASKFIQPGKWDTAVGGHVDFGEDVLNALRREAAEELHIENPEPIPLKSYIWESEIEKELVFSFVEFRDHIFSFDKNEIEEVRFWSFSDIKNEIPKGIFTPNFVTEFEILQQNIAMLRKKIGKTPTR